MYFPLLENIKRTKRVQRAFGGYVHRSLVPDGAFYDMCNLTSSDYPLLSVRKPRGQWRAYSTLSDGTKSFAAGYALFPGEGVTAAANVNNTAVFTTRDSVFAGGRRLEGAVLTARGRKTIAPFGKNFFIAPDGMYVSRTDSGYTCENVHVLNVAMSAAVGVCDENGIDFTADFSGSAAPEAPSDGYKWLDVSGNVPVMKFYSRSLGAWMAECPGYVSVSSAGIGAGLKSGDSVTLSGFSEDSLNGDYRLIFSSDDKIAIEKAGSFVYTQSGKITAERCMPVLDFVIEHNNRLFGCRYGENDRGEFVNEIYVSAHGNPLRWFSFNGISSDSFIMSLGCSGEFTGAGVLGSDVIFFKENYIIRVSGFMPSDFISDVLPARGVESGASLSVVCLNEKLFYKSVSGIMSYDGTLPVCISSDLGNQRFSGGTAGTADGKYYIAMTDEDGVSGIFVYDTTLGVWHREDDRYNAKFFINMKNCLYIICRTDRAVTEDLIINMYAFFIHDYKNAGAAADIFSDTDVEGIEYIYTEEENIEWFAQTGDEIITEAQSQTLSALSLRLSLGANASFRCEIMCNSDGIWRQLCDFTQPVSGTFSIPVNTPRCERWKLRFSGKGDCKIYSVTKITEKGSEINAFGR